jgi:hypothetical protein
MQHRTCEAATGRHLDPTFVALESPSELLMYQAIAAETESTRAALRGKPSWNFRVPQQIRGFAPAAKRLLQPETTLADLLPWSALLTLEGCAENAAQRAGCTKQEILKFALSICPYEHIVTVLNFMALDKGSSDVAKILSPLIRGLKTKEARIKQGASIGGKKSARTRQSNAKTPSIPEILQERERLLDSGREASGVAGILAQRYGVHPNSIRRKLQAAAKAQEP